MITSIFIPGSIRGAAVMWPRPSGDRVGRGFGGRGEGGGVPALPLARQAWRPAGRSGRRATRRGPSSSGPCRRGALASCSIDLLGGRVDLGHQLVLLGLLGRHVRLSILSKWSAVSTASLVMLSPNSVTSPASWPRRSRSRPSCDRANGAGRCTRGTRRRAAGTAPGRRRRRHRDRPPMPGLRRLLRLELLLLSHQVLHRLQRDAPCLGNDRRPPLAGGRRSPPDFAHRADADRLPWHFDRDHRRPRQGRPLGRSQVDVPNRQRRPGLAEADDVLRPERHRRR